VIAGEFGLSAKSPAAASTNSGSATMLPVSNASGGGRAGFARHSGAFVVPSFDLNVPSPAS
jgi:hypothetical protein